MMYAHYSAGVTPDTSAVFVPTVEDHERFGESTIAVATWGVPELRIGGRYRGRLRWFVCGGMCQTLEDKPKSFLLSASGTCYAEDVFEKGD